jgi:hypothetical protein
MDAEGFRRLALTLPEVEEHDHFGRPSFRVRGKIFATLLVDELKVNLKLPREEHEALVASDPDTFSTVTWGPTIIRTRVDLARADDELGELVEEAWRSVAPKRLIAAFETAER